MDYKVHPFAARFPMLPPDQLNDLAADIKAHGQVYPCMIDAQGVLLDGRNRLAACKIAGVEPMIRTWEGDNPETYILSVNVHRRHIPKSVQAMAVALVYPEAMSVQEIASRGGEAFAKAYSAPNDRLVNPVYQPSEQLAKTEVFANGSYQTLGESLAEDVSKQLLSRARVVLREFGPDSHAVQSVMDGGSLKDMYQQALDVKRRRAEVEKAMQEIRDIVGKCHAETPVAIDADPVDSGFTKAVHAFKNPDEIMPRLQEERDYLNQAVTCAIRVKELSLQPVIDNGWWLEGFVAGVIGNMNDVIKTAKEIADKHRELLNKPRIRKVK
jgi:ParB-like nuclease domain